MVDVQSAPGKHHAPARTAGKHEAAAGNAHPLGATVDSHGVNFSLFSQNATGVELLLFENELSRQPYQTIVLDPRVNRTFSFWHVYVKGLKPGTHYGYRVDGSPDLDAGHRFDRNKIALDPYGRGISMALWDRAAACEPGDNVEKSMRSVVIDRRGYDWEGDHPLNIATKDLVIYEMHVGGFTSSPSAGVKLPGTFAGVIEKIPYLQALGVNAVELLPTFAFDRGQVLRTDDRGRALHNYWGYSTVGFFAPESTYCESPGAGSHLNDFRDMVKALHKAGIEVILDVVFNHTDEGNHQGPAMSFRLIDNSIYYHLVANDKRYYMDYSGCGNTLNCNHPIVAKMILECLEFWVREMHVDGFRFDEGSILTRDENGIPVAHPPVVWAIELSETLSTTKIIAEAWDAAGAYQIGYFPGYRWAEWNGRFRDDLRDFVRGNPGMVGAIACRLSGSADIYQWSGHAPINSINFVTCHDGFTLNDLVSYNEKHNWANGESNNDGANDNKSWNCGVEGPGDEGVERFRSQQVKNFLALLFISQGVPMITGGDEIRRTQGGNNNAYCQDDELSWMDWSRVEKHPDVLRFMTEMITIRNRYNALRRGRFFTGQKNARLISDIEWHGTRLGQPPWGDPQARQLAVSLGGEDQDFDIHLMMNMGDGAAAFELPKPLGHHWRRVLDTSLPSPDDITPPGHRVAIEGDEYLVNGHSIVVVFSTPDN